ncbi:hypothetical protein NKG05_11455 [Oerskovia sp. M15]
MPRSTRCPTSSSTPLRCAAFRLRTRVTSSSTSRETRCGPPGRLARGHRVEHRLPVRARRATRRAGREAPFRAFWAHDLEQEKQALVDFLAYLAERRARFPGLHVYHYASYEKTHLLSIAARHGVCEQEVDDLLREGVLVDLYSTVRHALKVSAPSYSIRSSSRSTWATSCAAAT